VSVVNTVPGPERQEGFCVARFRVVAICRRLPWPGVHAVRGEAVLPGQPAEGVEGVCSWGVPCLFFLVGRWVGKLINMDPIIPF